MEIVRGYYLIQVREGLSGEVTLSNDLKEVRKGIYKNIWGKSKCKGPKAGRCGSICKDRN